TTGDDTKTTDITYTDETGTSQTVTVTKGDDGTWTVPTDSGVTVDPTTGAVTIPADSVQDGSTVSAVSKDEAGNTSNPATDKAKNDPDTTAPAAPAIETDLTGKAGTTDPIKVTGAEPGSTVTLKDPAGNVIGTGTANDNGEVEITPTTPLPEGSITATSTDKAGNESEASEPKVATTPDTTAPEAPTIETDLTGKAGTTDPVKVTGAEPGSTVTLKDKDGNVIGTGTADENGVATITPTTPLPEGQVTATSTDEAGNESEASEPKVATTPDTTAPEAPVVNAPKEGDTTVTGKTEPGATVTVTFPDGSTATTTADEDGNYTVDVPAGVELKEGDKVTATATDKAGNVSEPTETTTTANPSDADENTPKTPAVTPVEDTNNLTDDEKAKVKEEVEKSNPDLPTGTTVEVGNDGTVTITYPDGSVDTIPGTETVTPNTDTTAPEAPVVNAPKEGDTTVTGTAEPDSTVTVTFPDGSTVTTTADEDGNYTVDVPAGVELKEGDKVTA
ncbi:TPA: hypothetical protein U2D09_002198, partial [Streptococcus suis]|nr:hypothetical protein [Streptococcus suis]